MMKLLAFLWSGCWHKWDTVDFGNTNEGRGTQTIGRWFHERCSRCGVNRYRQQ